MGKTEEELKEAGIEYRVSKFNFQGNGKSLALGNKNGFVKILSDGEKVLGVHILGPHANDLIGECALAMANNLSLEDITSTIHAHPTLSESIYEASAGILEEAIHIAPIVKKQK